MSASPYFYIERYNAEEDKWENVTVYVKEKDKFIPVSVWMWNGTHELFSILEAEYGYEDYGFNKVHYGLPKNASDEIKDIVEKNSCTLEKDGFNYIPKVLWINLADALLYLNKKPTVLDTDAMEEYWEKTGDIEWKDVPEQFCDNPLKGLVDRVYEYLNVWDDCWSYNRSESDIRIIYWVSR